ncbi:MAG: lipoate--protein ligase family protein [Candidatus Heimdallarchaeota archaeon]|nr:MAG: lipoate--protein ligase family protein [Candidatus Heimdallarchaeota archaeon]
MSSNNNEWDLIIFGENDSINTQTIWHAASLARSKGIQKHDLVIIDWPKDPIVSCGLHQSINKVVDLSFCELNNIPVVRRVCGGGAVLLDSNQLFYNVIAHIDSNIIPRNVTALYSKLLEPVVNTYRHFKVDANYRPVNDILVNGRKISGNGATLIESVQVLVGNFILDFPRKEMTQILKVPSEKFRDKVYKSLEAGITSFQDELGFIPNRNEIIEVYTKELETTLDIHLNPTELESETLELMQQLRSTYLTDEWKFQVAHRGKNLIHKVKIHASNYIVEGVHKSPGGLIQVICEFQGANLVDILISGDFWIYPDFILPQLEQHLHNIDLNTIDLESFIEAFLTSHNCESPGTTAADLSQSIQNAYQNISRSI